jgi:sigma-B regulation protein RsbU (phosphoserine phosphatase)
MDSKRSAPDSRSEDGRLELALKASNEGIWDWWTDRREIYYSRLVLEFLECRDRHAPNIFLEPFEWVHSDDRESFGEALANALDPGGPELLAVDCRVQTGGGGWCWLRIRGSVVRETGGRAVRLAGSMIDISQRKRAEAQIEEERHLLRMLIDHIPLQVYFKDRDSRFVLANRQMADWFGLEHPSKLIGRHDRDFFSHTHADKTSVDEQRIMETGRALTVQLERETWEGRKDTWVQTSKFPWRARDGKVRGTFGISSDVTELVEAQTQVSEFADELARRNRSYEEEVQLAREIQQALASSQFPEIRKDGRHLAFGSRYLPISGLAGDFFEVLQVSKHTVGLLVCDVMGHGVRAALIVAMLRGLLEKQRRSAAYPGAFLRGLNQGLCSILNRADATMFATAFYAVVDLEKRELRTACAGHPGAMLLKNDGIRQLNRDNDERGPGLGIIPKAEFPTTVTSTRGCERLLMFTDGILEAENPDGEPFFEKRLEDIVRRRAREPLEEMLDGIVSTVLDYAGNHHFDDDVCLLAAEWRAS